MSAKDAGGPAFPVDDLMAAGISRSDLNDGGAPAWGGMTLRDYFAAKAMAAFLANPHNVGTTGPKDISTAAWNMADHMLASRTKETLP